MRTMMFIKHFRSNFSIKRVSILCAALLCAPLGWTQTQSLADKVIAGNPTFPRVLEINTVNENFLSRQLASVNELTRVHFGRAARGNKSDLALLQRVVDQKLIEQRDKTKLQALGVVLAEVYLSEYDELEWQVYEDELGKSLALCIKKTTQCLFPLTMLSRRIGVGARPDVNRIYQKGVSAIKPYLPKKPFQS